MSIVVDIHNGILEDLVQDNENCDACDGTCVNNECFQRGTDITQDPSIFISWLGTDKDKDHCISHAQRLSRFTRYAVGNIYDSAVTV